MSLGDIMFIILFVLFCIDLIVSIVCMVLNHFNKKRELEYVRHIIRMKECEIIGEPEEVEKWGLKQSYGSSAARSGHS